MGVKEIAVLLIVLGVGYYAGSSGLLSRLMPAG